MRLVDADALMEKLNVFNDRVHGNEHFLYGIETAKELLEDTPTVTEAEIRAKAIDEVFDLRPGCIIRDFSMKTPPFKYEDLASYGHFGRPDVNCPWEYLDKVEQIQKFMK